MPAEHAPRPRRIAAALVAVGWLALAPGSYAQRSGTPVQPGLWELVVETRSAGLVGTAPGQPRDVRGLKVCFGPAQAADPVAFLSNTILPPARGCAVESLRQSGPRATWIIACPADLHARGNASFEFAPTRFSGTMRHETAVDPKTPDTTTYLVQARRLGEC